MGFRLKLKCRSFCCSDDHFCTMGQPACQRQRRQAEKERGLCSHQTCPQRCRQHKEADDKPNLLACFSLSNPTLGMPINSTHPPTKARIERRMNLSRMPLQLWEERGWRPRVLFAHVIVRLPVSGGLARRIQCLIESAFRLEDWRRPQGRAGKESLRTMVK
jgi:hypothetical protein